MSEEPADDSHLEIAHVLFIDMVGYSKLLTNEQRERLQELNRIVRETEQVREADAAGKLVRLPTGDGMVLAFFTSPDAPVRCALAISGALKALPQLPLRMGIHSGPVDAISDVNDRPNVAGAGINMAQRVMDCGDAGHVLLSKRSAEDLAQYTRWQPFLHDLGEVEVKHGVRLGVVNFHGDGFGNAKLPEKLQRAQAEKVKVAREVKRRRKLYVAGAAAFAFILLGIGFWISRRVPAATTVSSKSIAVLPFENLSADAENAYFASGIQDDILTNLAKVGDLKVISRTSVEPYKGKAVNVRDIGKALGVAAILEGSVRRAGNRVRINVQLINATNDAHIWAEDYDREMTDVFAIQSDLALRIASTLKAKLSPSEKVRVQQKPTENADAYLLYLQAQEIFLRSLRTQEDLSKGEQIYQRAIALDPTFALAFAQLSHLETVFYNKWDPTSERLAKAKAFADEALRLQADLPEGHVALGYYYYQGRTRSNDIDYAKASAEFHIALRSLPNDPEVHEALGKLLRHQGKWVEALAHFEKAAAVDPNFAGRWNYVSNTNQMMRNYPAAARVLEHVIALEPHNRAFLSWRQYLEFAWKGDVKVLEKVLALQPTGDDPDGSYVVERFTIKMLQRKFPEAEAALLNFPKEELAAGEQSPTPKSVLLAEFYSETNQFEKARKYYEAARPIIERRVQDNPKDDSWCSMLGEVYAGLGRKEDAVREGKHAVELLPESRDAWWGLYPLNALAGIYTMLGEADLALPLIEHSLATPGGLEVQWLRFDPAWDPLRSDPRFKQLLEKYSRNPRSHS